MTLKNDPKILNAWCMYDWANSVYLLVITSTIFPVYFNGVTKGDDGTFIVDFFGFSFTNTVLYSYSLSFSFLVIAFLSPLLSGISDSSGLRKRFMQFFTFMGAMACGGLFFFTGESDIEYGIILSVLASIGYSGSLVFYNSFLPVIATPERYDFLSARGYTLGYIGSVLLLIINLVMISKPEWFLLQNDQQAARWSFFSVGLWWAGFSLVPFYYLPRARFQKSIQKDWLLQGYHQINRVLVKVKADRNLLFFLIGFFFYSTGVQTVMFLAATFGDKELNLPADSLILIVLIIQLVAILGAYGFAWLSKKRGNKFSLISMICVWLYVCFQTFFIDSANEFYFLAVVVGLVMGGIQSLSRSTYSKLIPTTTQSHASYFSFYDMLEKLSIVLGTLSFGLIEQLTGSMRNSAFALTLFFMVGMICLTRIAVPRDTKV